MVFNKRLLSRPHQHNESAGNLALQSANVAGKIVTRTSIHPFSLSFLSPSCLSLYSSLFIFLPHSLLLSISIFIAPPVSFSLCLPLSNIAKPNIDKNDNRITNGRILNREEDNKKCDKGKIKFHLYDQHKQLFYRTR